MIKSLRLIGHFGYERKMVKIWKELEDNNVSVWHQRVMLIEAKISITHVPSIIAMINKCSGPPTWYLSVRRWKADFLGGACMGRIALASCLGVLQLETKQPTPTISCHDSSSPGGSWQHVFDCTGNTKCLVQHGDKVEGYLVNCITMT